MLMFGKKLGYIALRIVEIAEDEGTGDARVDAGGCGLRLDAGGEALLDARVDALDAKCAFGRHREPCAVVALRFALGGLAISE